MSRLSKFLGESIEISIDGEKIKVYPLKVKDLALFKENPTPEEQQNINKEIVKRSLRDEVVTDEEVDNLSSVVFKVIMDAVNEVNGFKEDERIRAIKEKIISSGTK